MAFDIVHTFTLGMAYRNLCTCQILMLLAFILAKIDAFIQTDRWKVPNVLNFRAIPRLLLQAFAQS